LNSLSQFVNQFGYNVSLKDKKSTVESINKLLKDVKGKKEGSMIELLTLKSMPKAVYTTQNVGHYGLGFEHYTHFTSPIRRYPDLLAHRMLFEYLNNNPSPYNEETIESFAKHSSLMEQKAAEAERASVKYKMAELMKKHEGEIFEARISGITEWGIYATILDLHAEGLIKVSEIKFDRFYYVEDERKLMGKRTKRSFHM
jgi:VacB/RNase II family 3'-5' exoribonuclease